MHPHENDFFVKNFSALDLGRISKILVVQQGVNLKECYISFLKYGLEISLLGGMGHDSTLGSAAGIKYN